MQFLFFGKIVAIGNENPAQMLEIVNEILSESDRVADVCDPLIDEVLADLEAESEYQSYLADPGKAGGDLEVDDVDDMDDIIQTMSEPGETQMSREEITDAIIDAYQRGDMDEVKRLESMLKESVDLSSFEAFVIRERKGFFNR